MTTGRKPKPYFKKQSKRWVCTINGKRVTLGRTRKEADKKFHELMASGVTRNELETVRAACLAYLIWLKANRKPKTLKTQKAFIEDFAASVPKSLKIADLRPHHVTQWSIQDRWNSTSQSDAIGYAKRVFNWCVKQGLIQVNPIGGMERPERLRGEVFYTEEQFTEITGLLSPQAADILSFLWWTGARPREARTIEKSNIKNGVALFKIVDSKGMVRHRAIYLVLSLIHI